MSKNLKIKNPSERLRRVGGRNSIETKYPETSSITMWELSFSLSVVSASVEAFMPTRNVITMKNIRSSAEGFIKRHRRKAKRLPAVPGATGEYPTGPTVAIFIKIRFIIQVIGTNNNK